MSRPVVARPGMNMQRKSVNADDSTGESASANRAKPAEPVLYVNDARYERLWSLWKETRGYTAAGAAAVDGEDRKSVV